MADYRLPGPVCASQQTLLTDNGSLPRDAGCPRGPVLGADAGHASDLDPRVLWRRAQAVQEASAIGLARAPAAIVRETGLDDMPALARGILEGVLAMLAVVGVTTVVGGAAGGAIGALFGGAGAAPGAVIGAQLGMDAGVAVLGWLGLAFLAVEIGRGLGEIGGMVTRAVGMAWDAEGTSRRAREIDAAGQLLADAVGRLMLLIVMAVVARLAAGQAAGATGRASASAEELYAALRRSRLGAGFADWVKANAERLLRDPRLRRHREVSGTGAKAAEAMTPSQMSGGATKTTTTTSLQAKADFLPTNASAKHGTVTTFRVEGKPNQRIMIDETGDVSLVPDNSSVIWLNFGQDGRSVSYLQAKIAKGLPGAEIKSFDVDSAFLAKVRAEAVPEKFARQYPGRPIISSDPYPNQFGLPKEYFDDLLNSIVKGSGKNGTK